MKEHWKCKWFFSSLALHSWQNELTSSTLIMSLFPSATSISRHITHPFHGTLMKGEKKRPYHFWKEQLWLYTNCHYRSRKINTSGDVTSHPSTVQCNWDGILSNLSACSTKVYLLFRLIPIFQECTQHQKLITAMKDFSAEQTKMLNAPACSTLLSCK